LQKSLNLVLYPYYTYPCTLYLYVLGRPYEAIDACSGSAEVCSWVGLQSAFCTSDRLAFRTERLRRAPAH